MIIQCIPNFSEGRRMDVCEEIKKEIIKVQGITFLDLHTDADHNRSVFDYIGCPDAVAVATFMAAQKATELIDLNLHQGQHPRMGAVDVIPFVPLRDASIQDCINIARTLGEKIGQELQIPVFLYEESATRPERKNLANIRAPQFEGLRELIGKDERYTPDFGPNRIHPTAGAVAIGARKPLIAYNVDLDTQDVKIAKKIARAIREKDGGLPAVKALGIFMESRNCAQVTVNLCDYKLTSLLEVFSAIEKEAAKFNVGVKSSEIVGLLPQEAIRDEWIPLLKLNNFSPHQIIENHLP